ncbi:hypothetical protein BU23DRAFT_562512 [Bimuria novae-zelandiae CBS 107.79]|uniref:Apple domain-containing protein n=1 Tax=Bimuria novae-zelandiae CBS 107.79 TaxID=1447943 RepID=A0A6A5VTL4_9PLEO|nr:hypothetical protein BU23DRAFT_562512 [Bimuria novae-zelandiae CBS 107.79]
MVNAALRTTAMALAGRHLVPCDLPECDTTLTCPEDNNCLWTHPFNNAQFVTTCDLDFEGGDLQTIRAKDFTDCLSVCSLTHGCVAVTFREDGFCYLKDSVTPGHAGYVCPFP